MDIYRGNEENIYPTLTRSLTKPRTSPDAIRQLGFHLPKFFLPYFSEIHDCFSSLKAAAKIYKSMNETIF